MMHSLPALPAACLAIVGLLPAASAAPAEPFHISDPQQLPFLPETIMAEEPEVCDYVEGVIRKGFLRVGRPVFDDSAAIVPFRPYGVGPMRRVDSSEILRADADIDNDGADEVIVRYDTYTGGSRLFTRFLAFYRREADFLERAHQEGPFFRWAYGDLYAQRDPRDPDPRGPQAISLEFDPNQLRLPGNERLWLSGQAGFTLFSHAGRQYLYLGQEGEGTAEEAILGPDHHTGVAEFKPSTGLSVICVFRATPAPDADPPVLSLKPVKDFDNLLTAIRGKSLTRCHAGMRGPPAVLRRARVSVLYAASLAPWRFLQYPFGFESLISSDTRSDPDHERWVTLRGLSLWAERGIWNEAKFGRLKGQESRAVNALARHYVAAFGYDRQTAREIAAQAMTALLVQTFILPSGLHFRFEFKGEPRLERLANRRERAQQEVTLTTADQRTLTLLLERALLHQLPSDDIEALIARGADIRGATEPALFFALRSPPLMALLLQKGADVNVANAFGKTALMYAAQLNDRTALSFLLENAADPNRATRPFLACETEIKIGGRTALMYAAENASLGVIQRLVSSGANIDALDTRGWRAADYLRLNEVIGRNRDRSKARTLLGG